MHYHVVCLGFRGRGIHESPKTFNRLSNQQSLRTHKQIGLRVEGSMGENYTLGGGGG